ncbi:hypothetical protein B5S28_g4850 [[Candida] boidinii]|nr:hypothetical protein B5S28_g4850 [[Candida] boidinii]OWB72331.1 hypothetical protein B5S31_g2038 [[Candida] boidinii]
MSKVVVIGAGVIGLTNALMLLQKGYDVTIIAKHLPSDFDFGQEYTSPIAGANWHSFANNDQIEIQNFDKPGYKKFLHFADYVPKAGVVRRKNVNYITKDKLKQEGGKIELPWFKDFVEGFRILNENELPSDIGFGFEFDGVVISTTIYLNYLLLECVDLGATYKRVNLTKLSDAIKYHSTGKPADLIVNCSGLLAKHLVNDKTVYPVRGQVLLVENSCPNLLTVEYHDPNHPNEMLYIMPRKEGGSVIGGCFLPNPNDNNGSIDYELAERILINAKKYMPKLIDSNFNNNPNVFKIIRYQVGYRPFREDGYRIEKEIINSGIKVVHCYGHGGAGFQSSYGTCSKSVSLVDSFLSNYKL